MVAKEAQLQDPRGTDGHHAAYFLVALALGEEGAAVQGRKLTGWEDVGSRRLGCGR